MTLILKLGLDMVKMYLHTKNEVSMLSGSKVIAWTDRNTDRQTDRQTDMTKNITYPHMRVVKSKQEMISFESTVKMQFCLYFVGCKTSESKKDEYG